MEGDALLWGYCGFPAATLHLSLSVSKPDAATFFSSPGGDTVCSCFLTSCDAFRVSDTTEFNIKGNVILGISTRIALNNTMQKDHAHVYVCIFI